MKSNETDQNGKRFLAFLVKSVPKIEPSPFFAARVAGIAQVERFSFAGSLQAFARRLVPVFVTLMAVVCFAADWWTAPDPVVESAMFYDEEYFVDNITLESVMDSLASIPLEQNEDH